jgi:adenylate cyclase class 2
MARETEIKLRITDAKALRRALNKLGAKTAAGGTGRVHEWNTIFDTPEGGLAKHGQLLRIRIETAESGAKRKAAIRQGRVLLTFKRHADGAARAASGAVADNPHKVREEIEVEVADGSALAKILEGMGLRGWFSYEKYRTTFRLRASQTWAKGLLIELDETPIGTFVELEGPPEAIDRAARELGFSKSAYVLKNYLVLYLEECRRRGQEPRDMVFDEKNQRATQKK